MRWANPGCDDPACPGLFVNSETLAVERCDTCKLFDSDESAAACAEALIQLGLQALARRPKISLDAAAATLPIVGILARATVRPISKRTQQGDSP